MRSSLLTRLTPLLLLTSLAACSKEVNIGPQGGTTDGGVSPDPSTVPDDVLAISGSVTDRSTHEPIAGALVTTEPPIGQIVTNSQGSYVFVASTATSLTVNQLYRITASEDSYTTNFAQVLVQAGHNKNIDIQLDRASASYYLVVEPLSLDFTDTDFSGSSAAKTIRIHLDTTGAETTQYSTVVDASARSWLSAQPASGTVGASDTFVDITVDPVGLGTGLTTGTIDFTVPGDTQTLSVRVTLTSPVDGG